MRDINTFMSCPNRYVSFWHQQMRQVFQGGMPVLNRKIRIIALLSLLPLSVLVVMFIRCLRPLMVIRFGKIDSDRIGALAGRPELYLCERDAGIQGHNTLDLFYFGGMAICNQQLAKMWKRCLRVSSFVMTLRLANNILPGGEKHVVNVPGNRDDRGLLRKYPSHLIFTPEEEVKGYNMLQSMGVTRSTPFVCLHARDSAYLKQAYSGRGRDWRYHDFNDSNIDNHIKAAEMLVKRGYVVFRMGAFVEGKIAITNPKIIDYATAGRSDFMDVFLESKCSFHLGSCSGLDVVPLVFRRPRASVNNAMFEHICTWGINDLFIPKKMWLIRENRYMTFREIFESGVGSFARTEQCEEYGLKVVENTPDEIMDLAIEMDKLLNGTCKTTQEDEELQRRFWDIFPDSKLHGEVKTRIGAKFLRDNRELLE
jgi:putative glycosyltransferase (TIGR04372 family)